MRHPRLARLIASTAGSAAAEMAMVAPIFVVLMFGAVELGNYFLSEHVVVKAVRDGARYASRLNFSNYPCASASTGNVPGGSVVTDVGNVARNQLVSGGSPRLVGWTDATTITVSYDCVTTNSGADYSGLYKGMTLAPTVNVSATVPYNSLFNNLGFTSTNLSLRARSQAAVMGL
nr:TadE/TadG family type IV pilus assembly protein [uncultured Sphingomonas sp.]